MYHLYFYVPESHLDAVKAAIFAAGAGNIGEYEQCCWQTKGIGQFLPKASANPAVGQTEQLEQLAEYKVELVVDDSLISVVIKALKKAHPYEEPAYGVIKLENNL